MAEVAAAAITGGRRRPFQRLRPEHQAQADGRGRRELRRRVRRRQRRARAISFDDATSSVYKKLVVERRRQAPARRHPGRRRRELRQLLASSCRTQIVLAAAPGGARSLHGADGAQAGGLGVDALPDAAHDLLAATTSTKGAIWCGDPRAASRSRSPAIKGCTKAGTGCGIVRHAGHRHPERASCKKAGVAVNEPHLRALRALAPGALPPRAGAADRDLRRLIARRTARATAARSASPRWPRSSPRRWNEHILKAEHAHAAGHQRPLPRQHPARRHLLGGAARPGRRDHAGSARSRLGDGREEVRPLHRRSPAASASTCSARALEQLPDIWRRARRRRLRVGPRLRQGAAHREVLRRQHLVPLRRAGLGRLRGPRSRTATRALRSPHKLKCAVSGCTRECAEAQGKDFGVDRHREGLQPLRLRQRRDEAAARPAVRARPRRGDAHPATSTGS